MSTGFIQPSQTTPTAESLAKIKAFGRENPHLNYALQDPSHQAAFKEGQALGRRQTEEAEARRRTNTVNICGVKVTLSRRNLLYGSAFAFGARFLFLPFSDVARFNCETNPDYVKYDPGMRGGSDPAQITGNMIMLPWFILGSMLHDSHGPEEHCTRPFLIAETVAMSLYFPLLIAGLLYPKIEQLCETTQQRLLAVVAILLLAEPVIFGTLGSMLSS